jgi:hypothetical protein
VVTKRELLNELSRLRLLRYGWDRKDALPPRPDAMAVASAVISDPRVKLEDKPVVMASAMRDGTVEFVFPGRGPRPADLVVTFLCTDHADFVLCVGEHAIVEQHADSRDEIVERIAEHLDSLPPPEPDLSDEPIHSPLRKRL